MPLFPGYFRLSKESDRAYKLWLEGDIPSGPQGPQGPQGIQGPQGPAGPQGLGVVDYDVNEVELNISFTDGQTLYKKTFVFDQGPTAADPVVLDIDLASAIKVIETECWLDNGTFQIPVPSAEVQIIIVNGTTVVLTTPAGDFSAYTGLLTIYYYYADA